MARRDIVKTHGKVDVTGATQVLVPANVSRVRLLITNPDATNSVWAKVSTVVGAVPAPVAAADATCFKITPSTPFQVSDYTGPVALIASPGNTSVNVLEV